MLGFALRAVGRVHLVLLVLAVVLLLCQPTARRYGDRLQIALPMIAWGCAALNSSAAEFAARFLGMMVVTHTSKAALGNARINQRPSGGDKGFPSAHTAAAAFGASSLVSDCLSSHPTAKAIIHICSLCRCIAYRHTPARHLAGSGRWFAWLGCGPSGAPTALPDARQAIRDRRTLKNRPDPAPPLSYRF